MPNQEELPSSAKQSCACLIKWTADVQNREELDLNPETTSAVIAHSIFLGTTAKLLEENGINCTDQSEAIIRLRDKLGHIPWTEVKTDLILTAVQEAIPQYASELNTYLP